MNDIEIIYDFMSYYFVHSCCSTTNSIGNMDFNGYKNDYCNIHAKSYEEYNELWSIIGDVSICTYFTATRQACDALRTALDLTGIWYDGSINGDMGTFTVTTNSYFHNAINEFISEELSENA